MKPGKKGHVGGIQDFILSIVTIAIVLAIGLIVLSEFGTTAKELRTTTSTNSTVTLSSSVGQVAQGGVLFISASGCRNASDPETNFALNTGCNITSTGGVTVNSTASSSSVRIDYTHFTPSAAYNSTNTIITKLATVPTWIGIIIIVALAFIVLSFFIGKRQ